jgi:hypothetical protein
MEVVHIVLGRPELFEHAHILDQSPDGEDGDGEGDGSGKEVGELGEGKVDRGFVEGVNQSGAAFRGRDVKELGTGSGRDERGVLQEVSKDPGEVGSVRRPRRGTETEQESKRAKEGRRLMRKG